MESLVFVFPKGEERLPYIIWEAVSVFSYMQILQHYIRGFSHSSVSKESTCNAGDISSIPGSGRSPGEGNDNHSTSSCLENPMDREAWQATVHGVAKSQTRLND